MRVTRSRVERGVALSGTPARDWLEARGWHATAPVPHVFADVLEAPRFGYSRTWFAPGQYRREHSSTAAPSTRLSALLLVEGTAQLDLDRKRSHFGVGDLALIGASSPLTLSADTPVALYEIVTDYERMGLQRYDIAPTSGPHSTSENYWPALTGVINQVLGSSVTPEDHGLTSVRTAVESLLLASLKESSAVPARPISGSERDILRDARTVIHNEAHSSALTVSRLAELVAVSRAHLHRVFAADDSTPLAEIRAARVELARLHLSDDDRPQQADLLQIAHQSGFQTVSALKRALRESQSSVASAEPSSDAR